MSEVIKNIIKETTNKEVVNTIDQYLKAKGEAYPYQFAMQVLYEFITEDASISFAYANMRFIMELHTLLLHPEVSEKLYEQSNITPKGVSNHFTNLINFFYRLQAKEVRAGIDRIGLLEYPERYINSEWESMKSLKERYSRL